MLEVPIILNQAFFALAASALPILLISWLVRILVKSVSKTARSFKT